MRNVLLFLLSVLILSSSCSDHESAKSDIDIISYDMNICMDTLNWHIHILSSIHIEKPDSIKEIDFLFRDFIKIKEIKINKEIVNKFTQQNDTLTIPLNNQNILDLLIDYNLPIDSFGNNQFLLLTRPFRWCPFLYDNISEFRANITVPAHYWVYSSGNLKNERTNNDSVTFYYDNELNTGFTLIISKSNYYNKTEKSLKDMKVEFCFYNKDSILTDSIMNECIKTLNFCNRYIGKYNREKLTFIEIPNTMYCQSLETFLMAGDGYVSYYLYPQMTFWVSHETIHQWIGSGFFTPIKKDNKLTWFITESLTEYIRYQYIESQYGFDSLKRQIAFSVNEYETTIKGTEYDAPISVNQPNRATYLTGPLIFHYIRVQIGDKKWQEFIRKLYKENFGKILTYDKFYETLNLYACDNLMNKMELWVNTKGIPEELVSP